MKKKNLLMMALSLCMVAVIAVGGTLAYLSDTDGALKNTFTFADNISVDLYETVNGERNDSGTTFQNVVPGVPVEKDVDFTTGASVKTVVFVKIEAVDKSAGNKTGLDMILDMTGTDLNVYNNSVTNGYGEYYLIVDKDDSTVKNIFSKVTAPADADVTKNVLNDIKISISAVQYDGLEGVTYPADDATVVAAAYKAMPAYQDVTVTTPVVPEG